MKYHIELDIDLRRNEEKGLYIALEGIDGSGKTTQAELLTKYFKEKGKDVITTREPRKEGLIGDLVHKILRGEIKIPNLALQYLFTTERVMHHEEVILPSLAAGKLVISDRCFWSAVVYGILDKSEEYGYESANQLLIAQSILSMYHQFTVPDYTFYLNISIDSAMERINKKHESAPKEIYEEKEKVEKVKKGYDWLIKKFPKEFVVVDGDREPGEITQDLIKIIGKLDKA